MKIIITQEQIREHKGKPYHSMFGEIPLNFEISFKRIPEYAWQEDARLFKHNSLRKDVLIMNTEHVTMKPARPMALEEVIWKILREKYNWKGGEVQKITNFMHNPMTDNYELEIAI